GVSRIVDAQDPWIVRRSGPFDHRGAAASFLDPATNDVVIGGGLRSTALFGHGSLPFGDLLRSVQPWTRWCSSGAPEQAAGHDFTRLGTGSPSPSGKLFALMLAGDLMWAARAPLNPCAGSRPGRTPSTSPRWRLPLAARSRRSRSSRRWRRPSRG